MTPAKSVEIIGGGLAGLSLALNLALRHVPVTLHEAGTYPRHRVCGEFISGLHSTTIQQLGLSKFLSDAYLLKQVTWFHNNKIVRRYSLPAPAFSISRHTLDARLAQTYLETGGILHTQSRIDLKYAPQGRVFCTGRRRSTSKWIGLKLHALNLKTLSDLELHLGRHAYVGLSRIDNQRTNVCGLFRLNPTIKSCRENILLDYLKASALSNLADRLISTDLCPESCSSVAGFCFGQKPENHHDIQLGDTYAMMPPFTGNGMAMAFQSAQTALQPLIDWSSGSIDWVDTVRHIHLKLTHNFSRRIVASRILHPFLHLPAAQAMLMMANRLPLFPMNLLYQLTH